METSIRIAGLTVLAPVTVVTNLALGVQCALYYRRLRTEPDDRGRFWGLFFLAMSVATLAGALKHGLPHATPSAGYELVLWACALGSAASVYCAQRATLASRPAGGRVWTALPALEACGFLAAGLAVGPEMWLVVVNTAVGLVPVLAVESRAAWRGSRASAWVAAGLGVSTGSALAYVGHVSMGVWFNHVDLAHVLMGVSFLLLARGASGEAADGLLGLRPAAEEAA